MGLSPRGNVLERTMTSRLRDFMRTNPVILLVSKVGDDPQEFFDEVYNIVGCMGFTLYKIWKWTCKNSKVFLRFCLTNERRRGK